MVTSVWLFPLPANTSTPDATNDVTLGCFKRGTTGDLEAVAVKSRDASGRCHQALHPTADHHSSRYRSAGAWASMLDDLDACAMLFLTIPAYATYASTCLRVVPHHLFVYEPVVKPLLQWRQCFGICLAAGRLHPAARQLWSSDIWMLGCVETSQVVPPVCLAVGGSCSWTPTPHHTTPHLLMIIWIWMQKESQEVCTT